MSSNVGRWDGERTLAAMAGADRQVILDRSNQTIGEFRFIESSSFSEGLAAARTGALWGYAITTVFGRSVRSSRMPVISATG